ncbi:type II secretion system protein [Rubellicoccus peritrichatus]|uniref:Prepilin-type N-terminal cleavage/methylation domain-containing protein n=1 Tax=Rubellicoccus peritrichatus TaxID=3080537 RepID=A0AAQ3QU32_9BACT|nr:prepilin-type N-terminal cleavage/methylation domain-containing protein [Puniceicoccus sp. CR14]WOO40038.1 prepilin-type N-terminal cleavage/methylation domain-containing protein [Puniceicoccus sp. CR14]
MRKATAGFSLIEVLVALAIFALAVAMLSESVKNAMHGLEVVKSDSHKDQLYRFALRQVLLIEERDEVEDGGQVETPEDGPVDWDAEIEDTEILDLFQLTVSMSLADDKPSFSSGEPSRVEKLYVFRPGWSDGVDRSSLLTDKKDALQNQRLSVR